MDVLIVARRSRLVFPLAGIAILAMVLLSEVAQWRSTRTLREMGTVIAARATVRTLQQAIVDAEAGQRGSMLTGLQEYRLHYEQAVQRVPAAFQTLDAYYANQPQGRELLAQLHKTVDAKLSELEIGRASCRERVWRCV